MDITLKGEWILSSSKINWGNNVRNEPLDYKYKTIFKYKRNWEKLIDGWDVKIEENWKDPFSSWSTTRPFQFLKLLDWVILNSKPISCTVTNMSRTVIHINSNNKLSYFQPLESRDHGFQRYLKTTKDKVKTKMLNY
jgi:hypothetical protein